MTKHRVIIWTLILFVCVLTKGQCWNALGHRLIAQIAYNHLTPQAKKVANRYNHALDKVYYPQSLVNAAVWFDSLRDKDKLVFSAMHYISFPYSPDKSKSIPPSKINAILAIEKAKFMLQKPGITDFDKGFSLRILLHVIGDIHQPMHAVNLFSRSFPNGDKGGNFFKLGVNRIAPNLHQYWDRGGGWLSRKRTYSNEQVRRRAYLIEKHWPCKCSKMNLETRVWAKESYLLAIKQAYQIKVGQKPSKQYQREVARLTEQRIALAGCRLGVLLNMLITE